MQTGHSYLIVNKLGYKQIRKLKCISVTKTCYEILWQNSMNGNTVWFDIAEFEYDYEIIEDLGNLLTEQLLNQCK